MALSPLDPAPEIPDVPTSAPPKELPQPHHDLARATAAVFGVLQVAALALLSPLAALLLAINTWQTKYTSQIMLEALPALTSTL